MKIFIMYDTSIVNSQLNEKVMMQTRINLIYAEALKNELNKICSFEVIGPLKNSNRQLMSEKEQLTALEKHEPDLIFEVSVCCNHIGMLEKFKSFMYAIELNKYTLFIPKNAPKEIVILSQLIDELLTQKAQINNYIEIEQLNYKNMIKLSPGNVCSPNGEQELLREEEIKNFSMVVSAAITGLFAKKIVSEVINCIF